MKTTELENLSTNVETKTKQDYGNNLIEYRNIENSPFTIVKNEGLYYGVIGNHRLTEPYNDEKELEEELLRIDWNRLIQVIWAVVEKFNKLEKKENE